MAIKTEITDKLLSFFSLENDEQAEQFLNQFNEKFIEVDKAHTLQAVKDRAIGERMRQLTSGVLDVVKIFDPSVSFRSLEKESLEENLKLAKTKAEGYKSDLDVKLKDGSDKRVNDLMKEIEDKNKTIESYKSASETVSAEYEAFKNSSQEEIKNYKINHQIDNLKSKMTFRDDITDIERTGFQTFLNSNYNFSLNEQDEVIAKDKNGELIKNKNKAGTFLSPLEVFNLIAEENKLLKKNNADINKKNIFVPKSDEGQKNKLPENYLKRVKSI